MDWTAIIFAGVGGGVGALIGGILAAVFARAPEGQTSHIGTAVTVIGAVLGSQLGPALLDTPLGGPVRAALSDSVGDSIDELFASQPLFIALAEADPEAAGRMRQVVEEAYISGGLPAARNAARQAGEQLGFTAVITYGPRSPDAQLIAFQSAVLEVGQHLLDKPEQCYGMFYRDIIPSVATDPRFNLTDEEAVAILNEPMAALIRASGPEIIQPDYSNVAAAQAGLQTLLSERFAENGLQFMLGQAPETAEDFTLACTVMLDVLEYQVNHEHAGDFIRAGLMQN